MAAWGYKFYHLVLRSISCPFASLTEMLSALEDKIRIPARPCNILYLLNPLNLNSKKSIKLISIPSTNKL